MNIDTKGGFTEEEIQQATDDIKDILKVKETIYIVAGNRTEFDNYVRKKIAEDADNYGKEYIYVRDRYTLMGLSNITGYYIGTAHQCKDIDQIKQAIAYIKAK